jgi:K+-sensing histidine kinase KdpD
LSYPPAIENDRYKVILSTSPYAGSRLHRPRVLEPQKVIYTELDSRRASSRSPASRMLERHKPYLIATAYCLVTTILVLFCFDTPPPRFMDFFLIGIAFSSARWSWRPSILIYLGSLLVAAWVLPPRNSLKVSDEFDQFRMFSYSITCVAVVVAIDYAKQKPSGPK